MEDDNSQKIEETEAEDTQNERLAAAERLAAQAIGRYRDLVAASPGLVAGMVQGSTVEEIDVSAEVARQAYSEISRQLREQHEQEVPAGNPARSSGQQAAASLRPEAKIALGLAKSMR